MKTKIRCDPLCGSSPRMRGKPRQACHCFARAGLIPAHAGKTSLPTPEARRSAAHPRACGENTGPGQKTRTRPGSSPRMRGKPLIWASIVGKSGLIPAHAGKTSKLLSPLSSTGAHPRACGENVAFRSRFLQGGGSSPRMRGKRFRRVLAPGRVRLIPAHAGKTGVSSKLRRERSAHPRACGENSGAHQRI